MVQPKSTSRSFVSMHMPRPVPALIPFAQNVVQSMTGNAHFPTPTTPLADVSAAIAALQTAQMAVMSGLKGTVAARNDKKASLVTLMGELRSYVQKTADADPENAAAIIQSSGFALRKTAVHLPRVFAAKAGAVSGSVEVTAPVAARRSSYEWQYSVDGGKTWIEAPPSLGSKTTIVGLPVAVSVQLRSRAVTKAGPGDWTQPLAIVVK
jgi:hypothetical protein